MLVFLFYLLIVIASLLLITITILALSSVKIQILHLEATNTGVKYDIAISLFLGKIKYFKAKIDENFNKKIKTDKVIKVFQPQKDWKNQYKELKVDFEKLHIKLEEFHMKLSIGTEDVLVTTSIIVIISTIFPILLKKAIKKYDSKKYFYTITPMYTNKNVLKVSIDSIINIKLVHIIYVVILLIKRSGLKNDRTSNRRVNDDRNEQYTGYDRRQHNYRGSN